MTNSQQNEETEELDLRFIMLASYFADALECIAMQLHLKLNLHTSQTSSYNTWKQWVEAEFAIDSEWARKTFCLMTAKMSPTQALLYMMRGFGSVAPESALAIAFSQVDDIGEATRKYRWPEIEVVPEERSTVPLDGGFRRDSAHKGHIKDAKPSYLPANPPSDSDSPRQDRDRQ
ncbi:MAG: hypothetical protein FJ308_00625 [Planctomycetes bacterium]|nr:hypothetical protein [Planctomycetota bacterium]